MVAEKHRIITENNNFKFNFDFSKQVDKTFKIESKFIVFIKFSPKHLYQIFNFYSTENIFVLGMEHRNLGRDNFLFTTEGRSVILTSFS